MIKTKNEKVRQLYDYVQERCLWQFYSRAWDREANISNITRMAGEIISGRTPKLETLMDHQFYADAKELASGLKQRHAWVAAATPDEVAKAMDELRDELLDLAVKNSSNGELNYSLY
jgi:vanadium nitrogenase delta subunit